MRPVIHSGTRQPSSFEKTRRDAINAQYNTHIVQPEQRRRRLRTLALGVLAASGIAFGVKELVSDKYDGASAEDCTGEYAAISVEHGDTAWGLVEEHATLSSSTDIRDAVNFTLESNDIPNGDLQAGMILRICTEFND